MDLHIRHITEYRYDEPVYFGVQRLHMTAITNPMQTVTAWSARFVGATPQLEYVDAFANSTQLITLDADVDMVQIAVDGTVRTHDRAGVYGAHLDDVPLALYRTHTAYTTPGRTLRRLASEVGPLEATGPDALDQLHRLSAEIAGRIRYRVGATDAMTTAEQALEQGSGVCQDHAHVLISVARQNAIAARYVSGYLMMDGVAEQTASHAWCEVWIHPLGWVGFDVSNGISPDQRYVRLAVGRDYADASPVHGVRYGVASETLSVRLTVDQ